MADDADTSWWEFLPPSWRTTPRRHASRARMVDGEPDDDYEKQEINTSGRIALPENRVVTHMEEDSALADTMKPLKGGAPSGCTQCAQLASRVSDLEAQIQRNQWAAKRAAELSDAMLEAERSLRESDKNIAALSEANASLTQRNHHLETLLEEAHKVQQRSLGALASLQGSCLACLEHREAEARGEIAAEQSAARYAFETELLAYVGVWQFADRQCTEREIERMWEEDQVAHAWELRRALSELRAVEELRGVVAGLRKENELVKAKYRDLKERGRIHIEELNAAHEENMRRARVTYLRCNPNQAVLSWSFAKVREGFSFSQRAVADLGCARKELWVLREQLSRMGDAVRSVLGALREEVMGALRLCLPVTWKPTPVIHTNRYRACTPPSRMRPEAETTTFRRVLSAQNRGRSPGTL